MAKVAPRFERKINIVFIDKTAGASKTAAASRASKASRVSRASYASKIAISKSTAASQKQLQKFLRLWVQLVNLSLMKHKILSAQQKRRLRACNELTLVFVSSAQMKKINRQFRGRDYATDVLSFAAMDDFQWPALSSKGGGKDLQSSASLRSRAAQSLGELILCLPVIRRQAREHRLSFENELGYMVLHGILHLLGLDHEGRTKKAKSEAKKMFRLQDDVFEQLLG